MAYIRPMLATLVDEPFDRPGWVYEEKYDGIRLIAERKGDGVRFYTRNLIEREVPAVARELLALDDRDFIVDGELVSFDERGVSHFADLGAGRVVLAVFDCLKRDGRSIMKRPLRERRAALEALLGAKKRRHLQVSRRLEGGGLAAYETAQREGWEGIVAKDERSPYEPGRRSPSWLKVKVVMESEFVIGGYTAPSGARAHLGALLIGLFDTKGLKFAGKVGSGFDARWLERLKRELDARRLEASPFHDAPRFKKATWARPELVCQVRFTEWTGDGKLRHPVFLGLRDDKDAREVTWAARDR
jgi:bifunctional non-homologous end joining protein LigD